MAKALQDLHTKLALVLCDAIENGEKAKDDDGTLVVVTPSPALLNVARQFLKDNDIKAVAVPESAIDRLGKAVTHTSLPFEGAEDSAPLRH